MIFSKAAGVNDSIFGKSQEPIKAFLEQQEESFEQMSQIKNIFKMDKTNNFAEKYASETSIGDFEPVGENGAYPLTSLREGYSKVIEPETWKLQFRITQEAIEDGKLGKAIKKQGAQFMLSYHRTREKFAAAILRNGVSGTLTWGKETFDITCADGQPLFSTAHPSITGNGTQSNLYDAAFSYDNLAYAEEAMQKFTDDDGNLLNIQPDTIIIPNNAAIKKTVFEVLNAEGKPDTANNNGNYHFGRWNVIVWNYLGNPAGATSDWWLLMDSRWNEIYDGLVWLDRIPLTVKSWIDDNTDANVFNGRARWGAAPNQWRAFLACVPGSGASTF